MIYNSPASKKATGIICDLCGKIYESKFKYYSGKLDLVEVDAELQKTGIIGVDRQFLDVDFCVMCFNTVIRDAMLATIEKHKGARQ